MPSYDEEKRPSLAEAMKERKKEEKGNWLQRKIKGWGDKARPDMRKSASNAARAWEALE